MRWFDTKNTADKGDKRLLLRLRKLSTLFFVSAVIIGSFTATVFTPQSTYAQAASDFNNKTECEEFEFEWRGLDDTETNGVCVDPEASSCGIEGLGWVLCPVMDLIGDAADMAFNFLADQFLMINQEYVTSDSIGTAWGVMRTLANVAFVIAFMIIIYSQLTSTGISNYGVKKMLPRIIIAAILVNLSLFICQIAVDISNIAGYSLKSVFEVIDDQIVTPDAGTKESDPLAAGLGIAGLITLLLIGGVTLALAISGPVILAALLALLLIALILVARIALIVTLTIISPLAFVAFLLPNTEQWFKKWYKMFGALLMVFPVIAVVFGASSLVASIITQTATTPGKESLMMQVVATGVATIPLFMVPGLLKNSMAAAGSIGGKLSSMASKQQGAAASKGKAKAAQRYGNSRAAQLGKHMSNQMAIRRQRRQGGVKLGSNKNPLNWAGNASAAMNRGFNKSRLSGDFGNRAAARAVSFEDELFEKDVKDAALQQNGMTHDALLDVARQEVGSTYTDQATGKSFRVTNEQKTAAMDKVMATGGFKQRREMLEHIAQNGSQDAKARAVKAAYAKGDQNIYGVGFGDQILGGQIGSSGTYTDKNGATQNRKSLADVAVSNAAGGGLQAEHVVQSGSATEWLQGSIESSGDQTAADHFKRVADQARQSEGTAAKIDGKMDDAFIAGGSHPQPVASSTGGGSSTPTPGSPSAGSGGGGVPAGYTQASSGLLVPNSATGGTSSGNQPAPQQAAPQTQPAPQTDPTVLNVRQQAEQRVAEAATGTKGSTPFVVDSAGSTAPQTSKQADEAAAAREAQPKVTDRRNGGQGRPPVGFK